MSDKKHIIDAIVSIARKLGRSPSRSEFIARSGITVHLILRCFRSWNDAVRAAGFYPHSLNVKVEDRALLEDWGKQVRRNRSIHPRYAHIRQGKYNPTTIERRFGAWSKIPQVFRKFAKGKPEWADVVAILPDAPPNRDFARPQEAASGPIAPLRSPRASFKGRTIYGNPLHLSSLAHEPVNEQGVVLLFGMLAKDLGYRIEAVQKGFPDCEAKRQISSERWERVNIEFEYESKNFRDHGHAVSGCDVIVCWRHNWPECPKSIDVVELCSVIRSLGTS